MACCSDTYVNVERQGMDSGGSAAQGALGSWREMASLFRKLFCSTSRRPPKASCAHGKRLDQGGAEANWLLGGSLDGVGRPGGHDSEGLSLLGSLPLLYFLSAMPPAAFPPPFPSAMLSCLDPVAHGLKM